MTLLLIFLMIFILLVILFFLRSQYERHHLVTTNYEIVQPDVPAGLVGKKLVFLSDLHNCRYGENNRDLIQRIADCHPDMILFGGDMILCHEKICKDFTPLEEILAAFYQKVPMYYGFGNHEDRLVDERNLYPGKYEQLVKLLEKYEIPMLSNTQILLKYQEDFVTIADIDYTNREYKARKKLSLPENYVKEKIGEKTPGYLIMLSHSPLYIQEMVDYGSNLVLSGHFHGGTVRIPYLGGVMTPQYQFFYPHTRGCYPVNQSFAVVSGGLGTHTINIRFLNQPEVICMTLRKGEKNGY